MVHDDKPRNTWKLAIIEELIRGKDELVRAANIRTKKWSHEQTNHQIIPIRDLR